LVQHGGYGLDAQWSDDFHHALHSLLTKEQDGYYRDFGEAQHLVKAITEGFVYSGQVSPYRARPHGTPSVHLPPERFVVCSQNHDQVGNRMLGERLCQLLDFEQLKLAAAILILSPFLPLLFMGQEYGEPAPFQYFISHSDPDLIKAVRQGRRREFDAFSWRGEVPDPQSAETFERSKLNHALRHDGPHKVLLAFYKELIQLRNELPQLDSLSRNFSVVLASDSVLAMHRNDESTRMIVVLHLGASEVSVSVVAASGNWRKLFDSAEQKWSGNGSRIGQEIASDGSLHLQMAAHSACVLKCLA
jgi:maltooligosyltrehalose trehalohydrolase